MYNFSCFSTEYIVNYLFSLCHSGPRPELHPVTAHNRPDPTQTQPAPQGPTALR